MKKGLLLLLAIILSFHHIFSINTAAKCSGLLQLEDDLVINGSFESGIVLPWQGIDQSNLTDSESYQGNYSINITGEEAYQEWITVVPGAQYTLTAWFKWNDFGNSDWGYDHISVQDQTWSKISTITQLHKHYTRYDWHKIAISFVPTTDSIRISFGVFGPNQNIELYFDDFKLFSKTENTNPFIKPDSEISSGSVQSPIQFYSNAEDKDGAISYYFWDFGDGSSSTHPNPKHTYLQRGDYKVSLTAIDNEGGTTNQQLNITIADKLAPTIVLNTPIDTFHTTSPTFEITGKAFASTGRKISGLVWDNINTDQAEQINIVPDTTVAWSTETIKLKPGVNAILLTVTDTFGSVSTQQVEIYREITQPEISNISVNTLELSVYEKLEIQFDLLTTASTPFFIYEEYPPAGVLPGSGVTIEGIFILQDGTVYTQPGFLTNIVDVSNSQYHETPEEKWIIRFSPQKAGKYQLYIYARDSSGETVQFGGEFFANPPKKPGYIQVSVMDPRYFEFSDKTLFWPIGPAYEDNLQKNVSSGLNFSRIWFAGKGVYSSNFARWVSTSKQMGNEGFDSQLTFNEHLPGHELSQEIFYPEGNRIWIGWPDTEINGPKFKAHTDYLVKIRLKTQDISGPVDPDAPYGFMIKRHGWPTENLEASLRSIPSLIPVIENDRDWHTILATYNSGKESFHATPYISLYLDNVSSGEVYIDQFSIREILPDSQLGEELIINPKSDLHTYASSKPAKYFDNLIAEGEQNQVFYKFVVHDKRDWITNHLTQYGDFHENGGGYFQAESTKSRWLLEQWWRYLIARWGYSTAIHSWELLNEGPPNDPDHYEMANDFAQFMHDSDTHPHLVTTSFWSGWETELWTNKERYPDIDYADLHLYAKRDSSAALDETTWALETQQLVYSEEINMPIISGESGLFTPGSDLFLLLENANPGTWYHNFLWTQLSPNVVYAPNYWWSEHLKVIERQKTTYPFSAFIKDIPLNQGGFSDIQATWDSDKIRVLGQKNLDLGFAYLWTQNKEHTWSNNSTTPVSTTVVVKLNPNIDYKIEVWNTYTGAIQQTTRIMSDPNGNLAIPVEQLSTDVAIKINEIEEVDPISKDTL